MSYFVRFFATAQDDREETALPLTPTGYRFYRLQKWRARKRKSPEQISKRKGRIALEHFRIVHTGDARQLRFEMRHRFQVRIVLVEIPKSALQQMKQLRLMMIRLGANLDQLNEVGRCLRAQMCFANTGKRIAQFYLGQGMQVRSAAASDLDFGLEKQVEFPREWTARAARSFCHGLDAAQRLGAPGNDHARVA